MFKSSVSINSFLIKSMSGHVAAIAMDITLPLFWKLCEVVAPKFSRVQLWEKKYCASLQLGSGTGRGGSKNSWHLLDIQIYCAIWTQRVTVAWGGWNCTDDVCAWINFSERKEKDWRNQRMVEMEMWPVPWRSVSPFLDMFGNWE